MKSKIVDFTSLNNWSQEGYKYDYANNIKPPSIQVISIISRLSGYRKKDKKSGIIDTFTTDGVIKESPLYIRLLFFLEGHTILPPVSEQVGELGVTEKQLRKPKQILKEMGVLEKAGKTNYRINVDKLNEKILQYRSELNER